MKKLKSELREKLERLMVKYKFRTFCEHDISSMLNLSDDDDSRKKLIRFLMNMKTYFFIEKVENGVCEARQVLHSRYKATQKLINKFSDFDSEGEINQDGVEVGMVQEESQWEDKGEEEKPKKRKYTKRKKEEIKKEDEIVIEIQVEDITINIPRRRAYKIALEIMKQVAYMEGVK